MPLQYTGPPILQAFTAHLRCAHPVLGAGEDTA